MSDVEWIRGIQSKQVYKVLQPVSTYLPYKLYILKPGTLNLKL